EHNKKLIAKMPRIYALPGDSKLAKEGKTVYLAPLGESTMFPGPRAVSFKDVKDGLSVTIFLVEGDDEHAVIWTKPEDVNYHTAKLFKGLGKRWSFGGFFAAFVDGHVTGIKHGANEAEFKEKFIRAGRKPANQP